MFTRLLVESIRRGRRAKLLALVAVLLGVGATTALAVVALAASDEVARSLAGYGANLRVTPEAGESTVPVAELDALADIFWRNNLTAIAPLYEVSVRWSAGSASEASDVTAGVVAPAVGTWFEHPLAHWRTGLPATRPSLPIAGRWPADEAPVAEVALGRRLAERLGVEAPGASVAAELAGERRLFEVVGIVGGGGVEEDRAYAPLAAVAALAGRPGTMTGAEITALTTPEPAFGRRDPTTMSAEEYDRWYCTAYASSIALQVDEALPSARAEVVRQVAGAASAVAFRLRAVLAAIAAVVLLGALLGVASTMTATVHGRERELALLSALGCERGWIARFLLTEVGLVGLAGGLAGGLLGLAGGRWLATALFGFPAPWMPVLLPLAALVGLVVAAAGTARPLVGALARPPAPVLGGHRL